MRALQQAAAGSQIALGCYFARSRKPRPVWAVFHDRLGTLTWSVSKHNAKQLLGLVAEQSGEPLRLLKIEAP
jgi:hypothetical protein